jgi:hypothetical protein
MNGIRTDVQGLKKALGDFMKGLDFKSVAPNGGISDVEEDEDDEEDEEEREGSDVSSFDSDEDEEDDEEEDEDEEDDEEEEQSEEDPEPVVAPPVKAMAEKQKEKEKPAAVKPEVDNFGAKVSPNINCSLCNKSDFLGHPSHSYLDISPSTPFRTHKTTRTGRPIPAPRSTFQSQRSSRKPFTPLSSRIIFRRSFHSANLDIRYTSR